MPRSAGAASEPATGPHAAALRVGPFRGSVLAPQRGDSDRGGFASAPLRSLTRLAAPRRPPQQPPPQAARRRCDPIRGLLRCHVQTVFRRHFAAFAEAYQALCARHYYGRHRLSRIREVTEAFVRCGDLRFGVARLQCTNPECQAETFRPFSCQGTYLCPSCSQKRTLLLAEFPSRRLLVRLPHRVLTFTVPKILRPAFRFHPRLFADGRSRSTRLRKAWATRVRSPKGT